MRICTCEIYGKRHSGLFTCDSIILFEEIAKKLNIDLPFTLDECIAQGNLELVKSLMSNKEVAKLSGIPFSDVTIRAPFLNPPKIWCIGLNFQDHADDLDAKRPTDGPGSFMKPSSTIIGPSDAIMLPPAKHTERVTGEAELGVIIGKECKNISAEENHYCKAVKA